MPERIQRKRTEGWRMPDGAVYVGRPSRWGNPFQAVRTCDGRAWTVVDDNGVDYREPVSGWVDKKSALRKAVQLYYADLKGEWSTLPRVEEAIAELHGRDLACWCLLDQPCHADVLLEIANA